MQSQTLKAIIGKPPAIGMPDGMQDVLIDPMQRATWPRRVLHGRVQGIMNLTDLCANVKLALYDMETLLTQYSKNSLPEGNWLPEDRMILRFFLVKQFTQLEIPVLA